MDGPDKVIKSNFWSFRSARLYLALTFNLAIFANALMRNTLAMGMVCMVNSTVATNSTTPQNDSKCTPQNDLQQDYQGQFDWGSFEQGLMFSAIFVGGLLATLPAGWLADRYDPKMLVTVGILATTLGCYLCPITADKGGYIGLVAVRFLMGLFGQALVVPGISAISARWIPPTERSTVIAIYSAGNQMANIIGTPMNALLCGSPHFLGGWPSIFYVNATIGVVSGILWVILASNRPEKSRFISEREMNYITTALVNQNLGRRKEVTRVIPWSKILTSPIVWSILISNFAIGMMAGVLSSYMPTYFKDVLALSLVNNGLLGTLPYIVQWLAKFLFAIAADFMKKHTKLSPTFICKFFNTLSEYGVCVFLIACAYMTCSTAGWAVAFLSLSNAMFSANVPGLQTSIISIAPRYSGIMMSIGRFAGQLAAFLSPLIIAALTPDGTANEWKHVFFLIAGVNLIAGTLFLIFGSAAIQDWAKVSPSKPASSAVLGNSTNAMKNGCYSIKDNSKADISTEDHKDSVEKNSTRF